MDTSVAGVWSEGMNRCSEVIRMLEGFVGRIRVSSFYIRTRHAIVGCKNVR